MKKLLITFVSVCMIFSIIMSAYALVMPTSFYDSISWNWYYDAPATNTYNCLAYALGKTNVWVWPWSGYPTQYQVTSYLASYGYSTITSSSTAKIGAYGPSLSSITHFAKITSSSTCKAKWGTLERMIHYSLNPYYSTSDYGSLQLKYN